jgi:peptidoglycan glycosyltransferase
VQREQAEKFGIGDDSLRLPGRIATSVFPTDLSPPQEAQSAIGQFDVRVTPLQMALVAAGIANDGDVMRPYLVRELQAPDLSRLGSTDPEVYREDAVSQEVADQITAMMELVVAKGTATSAQIPGVRVAGKTGTAQNAAGQAPHAWFVGFAPADAPQVAVAVVVEDGGSAGSEATGGRVAAPIGRDVMRAVLGQ